MSAERERDEGLPLGEWRALWARVQPPMPPEELQDTDPATQRAVQWMRAAWSELDVPAPPLRALAERAPRANVRPIRRRWPALRPWHAAAAAAAALLVALLWFDAATPSRSERVDVAELPVAPVTPGAPATPEPTHASSEPAAEPALVQPVVPEVGELNLEFRSGSVRLVLVTAAGNGATR